MSGAETILRRHLAALALLGLAAGATATAAEAPREDGKPPPQEQAPSGPGAPGQDGSGSSLPRGNLSDELSRSKGVIRPPENVDPAMKQPAPSPGPQSMPVVPPPGTPGNKPQVEPK